MARPYSLDLRERVVCAVQSGQSCQSVADVFGVSVASVVKWSQWHRATGRAAAKPMGSRRPYILETERAWLQSRVWDETEVTTRALAHELAARGIVVSHASVGNILRRERQTFNKTFFAREQDRPDVAPPRLVATPSGEDRSCPSRLH